MAVAAGDPIRARDINYLATLYDQLTADAAAITTTTLVTLLTVTLPTAATYAFDLQAALSHGTAVGRPGFALGGTSVPTAWRWVGHTTHYNTATASQGMNASGIAYPASTAGTAIVNSDFTTTAGFSASRIRGTISVSAPGTLTFRFSEATGTGAVNVKAGTMVTVNLIG